MDSYLSTLTATLLISLRLLPSLSFAPPFTYLRAPIVVRFVATLGLSGWLAAAYPADVPDILEDTGFFVAAAACELVFGVAIALSFQLAFAALLTVARAVDFQVGFGLAVLADPTLKTQMPVIGALFAYAAGAVFFATGGLFDFLALCKASLEQVPIGAFAPVFDPSAAAAFLSAAFGLSLGILGAVMLVLFVTDLSIAFISRTLPQMNVLVFGFQVKTIILLVTLPFAFALTGAAFLRLVRLATASSLALP